jgi:hypothetical protein
VGRCICCIENKISSIFGFAWRILWARSLTVESAGISDLGRDRIRHSKARLLMTQDNKYCCSRHPLFIRSAVQVRVCHTDVVHVLNSALALKTMTTSKQISTRESSSGEEYNQKKSSTTVDRYSSREVSEPSSKSIALPLRRRSIPHYHSLRARLLMFMLKGIGKVQKHL